MRNSPTTTAQQTRLCALEFKKAWDAPPVDLSGLLVRQRGLPPTKAKRMDSPPEEGNHSFGKGRSATTEGSFFPLVQALESGLSSTMKH